jgi:hypothetical protein
MKKSGISDSRTTSMWLMEQTQKDALRQKGKKFSQYQ